ncbi:MAG: hypothetical protein ACHQHN_03360 [Sphingobacteriales bacterium]
MKTNFYLMGIAISVITISSCKKFDGGSLVKPSLANSSGADTDVYAAGYINAANGPYTVPTYWKNGVIHKLADSSNGAMARCVAVRDSDVLIAVTTEHLDNSAYTAVYYWDGHRGVLADKAFVGGSHCATFSACGCDYYICGAIMVNGVYQACYWQNGGPAHLLPSKPYQSIANAIAVHGGNIYVAGSALTSVKNQYAIYWKNDTAYNLTDTLRRDAQALDIGLIGNDVYVAGYELAADNNSNIPTYWINGVPHTLNKPGGIESMVTSGSNYYFGGGADDFGYGNYWINGVSYNLTVSDGGVQPQPNGVGVLGNDVYVAGSYSNVTNKVTPCYWKNGNFVSLAAPTQGAAISIAAVAH